MKPRTIEELVKEKYHDPEVQEFILKDVKERATGDKIVKGELVLPSEEDAERNLLVSKGEDYQTDRERKLVEENKRLKAHQQQPASKPEPAPVKGK